MSEAMLPRAGDHGRFHRPVRAWPLVVEPAPIVLPPVPAGAGGARRRWVQLLPMVGSLAMVGFALIVHSLLYFVVIVVMVVGMVGATLGTQIAASRDERRGRARARVRFLEALDRARAEARVAAEVQRAALDGLYPDPDALLQLVRSRDGVWERRPADPDFAAVRIGRGAVPAARPVVPASLDQAGAEPDPELAEVADRTAEETRLLRAAPVTIPLRELGVVGVVGPAERARPLVCAWLASLAALHAPGELRFVGLVPKDAFEAWDWLKWLPHCRDPEGGEGFGRARRSVGTDAGAFSARVGALVRSRLERTPPSLHAAGAERPPAWDHVMVLVDGWTPARSLPSLDTLMAGATGAAVSVVTLVDEATRVPAECGGTLTLGDDGTVRYVESGRGGRVETGVVADQLEPSKAERLARELAPLRLDATSAGASLGDSVRLAELLGADDPAAAVRVTPKLRAGGDPAAPSPALLRAPIGRDDRGQAVELDLKEAALGGMGPHGLLVGATGSGKSELLRSLAAGLAGAHHPSLLNLLLVDYKGGAAFAGLERLPHVTGVVTNLADEPDLVTRVQAALVGELERRQRLLRDAGGLDSIRDYHATRSTEDAAAMPYLVVIVDEFGELLAAEPDFLEIFGGIGRLGRSLGMHLLLSTQRLDEGRVTSLEPHLRYRVALRTNTAGESRSVLGSALAYELPPVPGLGYLQVDGASTRFKAAITTLPYRRSDGAGALQTQWLRPLSLLPATGGGATIPVDDRPRGNALGRAPSELDVLVDAVRALGDTPARRIWLPPLPERLTLGALDRHFGGGDRRPAALGLVDHPRAQSQQPLVWDPLGTGGNLGIAGGPRSGKSTFLVTLVLALTAGATPDEIQIYGLDLGGGSLLALRELAHVGAVVGPGEPEAATRLVEEVSALANERAATLAASGPAPPGPHVFVVVDNVAMIRHHCPDLEPQLLALATTGRGYGVHVVVSANRWFDVRPQLLDALGTKLELRLGDPGETLGAREAARRLPADRPGRGVTSAGEVFQLALPSWSEEAGALPATDGVADAVAAANARAGGRRAPRIAALPERVTEDDVSRLAMLAAAAGVPAPEPGGGFLLGIGEFRSRPVEIDLLADGAHLAVYGDVRSGRSTVLARAVRYLLRRLPSEALAVHVVDPTRRLIALADEPHVRTYATSPAAAEKLAIELGRQLAARQPPEDATIDDLRAGRLWDGPLHAVVVDDYDLLLSSMGSPLDPLAEVAAQARDVGLHLLVARQVAGSQRSAFDPFTQRLRELRPTSLVLAGPPDEGPVVAGVIPRPMPPGRGQLVDPAGRHLLVQCCVEETSA